MISLNPPKDFKFNNPENHLNQLDDSFESLCASMEEAGIKDPEKLTVFKFKKRIQYFKAKAQKKKQT